MLTSQEGGQQIAQRHTTILLPSVTTLPAAPVVRSQLTRHPTEGLGVRWESVEWGKEVVVSSGLLQSWFQVQSPKSKLPTPTMAQKIFVQNPASKLEPLLLADAIAAPAYASGHGFSLIEPMTMPPGP